MDLNHGNGGWKRKEVADSVGACVLLRKEGRVRVPEAQRGRVQARVGAHSTRLQSMAASYAVKFPSRASMSASNAKMDRVFAGQCRCRTKFRWKTSNPAFANTTGTSPQRHRCRETIRLILTHLPSNEPGKD